MNTTLHSRVFKRANELRRLTKESRSACLFQAWALEKLLNRMQLGKTMFSYRKRNGSLRKAIGRLNKANDPYKEIQVNNGRVIRYYDLEVQDFRCFRIENFIAVYS